MNFRSIRADSRRHRRLRALDYLRGCMIDRIARDGSFPPFVPEQPVWDQFP